MYVRTHCPVCGTEQYHNIKLHALETKQFSDLCNAARYAVEYIEVSDTLTEEEFARDILRSMRLHVHDGVDVRELCNVLKNTYGIAAAHCCDLIQRIKIELGMYCPDRKHLYYVDQVTPSEI